MSQGIIMQWLSFWLTMYWNGICHIYNIKIIELACKLNAWDPLHIIKKSVSKYICIYVEISLYTSSKIDKSVSYQNQAHRLRLIKS